MPIPPLTIASIDQNAMQRQDFVFWFLSSTVKFLFLRGCLRGVGVSCCLMNDAETSLWSSAGVQSGGVTNFRFVTLFLLIKYALEEYFMF